MSPLYGGLIALGASLILIVLYAFSFRKGGISVQKMVLIGMLLALAFTVSMFEGMIPDFIVPGFKLGFANIVILVILYGLGWKEALFVDVLRVLLTTLLRGTFLSMGGAMSFAGMALSFLGMFLLYLLWKKCSIIFVSIIGAILHDVGQILVAFFFMENSLIFTYLPLMVLVSFGTGALAGIIAHQILRRNLIQRYKSKSGEENQAAEE